MNTRATPIIFIFLGILLVWAGVNGTLGTLFASIFYPSQVQVKGG